MKKLILLFLLTFPVMSLVCQNGIQNIQVVKQGPEVLVSFRMIVPSHYVKGNYKKTLTPVLSGQNGEMKLTPIIVWGKNKERRDKQVTALSGKAQNPEPGFYINNGDLLDYLVAVPYQSWMKEVSLGYNLTEEGCCSSEFMARENLARNITLVDDFTPAMSPYVPIVSETEKLKEFFVAPISVQNEKQKQSLKVYYPVNVSHLMVDYKSNRTALDRIITAVSTIEKDTLVDLKKIVIAGYSSPEGPTSFNEKLADDRALALQKYIIGKHYVDNAVFDIINGGPDWDGLKEMVNNTDQAWKESVLNILDHAPEENRISEISALNNGLPYRYIQSHIFPELRNACYIKIYYMNKPGNQNQMGEKAWELVQAGRYKKAMPLLRSLPENGWSQNLLGVCSQMTGDTDNALRYFQRAAQSGDKDALNNLKQLE